MTPFPKTEELRAVARRVVWYKEPDVTLNDPVLFLCHLMTYTLPEDVETVQKYASDDDIREALDHAIPGIFDPRSWAYWNIKFGRTPVPPLPVRVIPDGVEELAQ